MPWSDWIDSNEQSFDAWHRVQRAVRATALVPEMVIDFHNHPPYEGEPEVSQLVTMTGRDDFLGEVQSGGVTGEWVGVTGLDHFKISHFGHFGNDINLFDATEFWWTTWMGFTLHQQIFSCWVDPAWFQTYPTEPDPEQGVYFESSSPLYYVWDGLVVGISHSEGGNPEEYSTYGGMDYSDHIVTIMPGTIEDGGGILVPDGFFANDTWPQTSDGTYLTTIEGSESSVILPLGDFPADIDSLSFTLIFTPRMAVPGESFSFMPYFTVDPPVCSLVDVGAYNEETEQTYQQFSIGTHPKLLYKAPRFKVWTEPVGVPPLRQRCRNDGLTTDTRQEIGRNRTPQQVDQWWVGRPGEVEEESEA